MMVTREVGTNSATGGLGIVGMKSIGSGVRLALLLPLRISSKLITSKIERQEYHNLPQHNNGMYKHLPTLKLSRSF